MALFEPPDAMLRYGVVSAVSDRYSASNHYSGVQSLESKAFASELWTSGWVQHFLAFGIPHWMISTTKLLAGVLYSMVLSPFLIAQQLEWQTDLYQWDNSIKLDREQAFLQYFSNPFFFLGDGTIAVSYLVPNQNRGITTQKEPGGSFLITTALLDSTSGKLLQRKEWGNAGTVTIRNAGSNLVVVDRYKIALLGPELNLLASVQHKQDEVGTKGPSPSKKILPDLNPVFWKVDPSLTGQTVTIMHGGGFSTQVRIFNERLTELLSFEYSAFFASDASDSLIAFTKGADKGITATLTLVSSKTGTEIENPIPLVHCSIPKFLSNELLLVTGQCSELLLFDATGKQVAHRSLTYTASEPAVSSDGTRFAVRLYTEHYASWSDHPAPRERNSQIVVFDSRTLEPISSVGIEDGKCTMRIAYALSPSGDRLAVRCDNHVRAYRVSSRSPK